MSRSPFSRWVAGPSSPTAPMPCRRRFLPVCAGRALGLDHAVPEAADRSSRSRFSGSALLAPPADRLPRLGEPAHADPYAERHAGDLDHRRAAHVATSYAALYNYSLWRPEGAEHGGGRYDRRPASRDTAGPALSPEGSPPRPSRRTRSRMPALRRLPLRVPASGSRGRPGGGCVRPFCLRRLRSASSGCSATCSTAWSPSRRANRRR